MVKEEIILDITKAASATVELMRGKGKSERFPQTGPLSFTHIMNMLVEIRIGQISGEKAHRWLGWAQCAIVSAGIATLDDMKNINHKA